MNEEPEHRLYGEITMAYQVSERLSRLKDVLVEKGLLADPVTQLSRPLDTSGVSQFNQWGNFKDSVPKFSDWESCGY